MDQQASRLPPIARLRHDGWTLEKQATFIIALKRTRNVSRAAAAAGMSRESAYRLRARQSAAGFAAAWDHALRRATDRMGHNDGHESHKPAAPPVGLPAREQHEGHSSGRTAPHRQFSQLHRLSPARRAELLALIERAGRG
ncbi:MAG: hypothetical protein ACREBK_04130 [Sphingomicrobium sp.]